MTQNILPTNKLTRAAAELLQRASSTGERVGIHVCGSWYAHPVGSSNNGIPYSVDGQPSGRLTETPFGLRSGVGIWEGDATESRRGIHYRTFETYYSTLGEVEKLIKVPEVLFVALTMFRPPSEGLVDEEYPHKVVRSNYTLPSGEQLQVLLANTL